MFLRIFCRAFSGRGCRVARCESPSNEDAASMGWCARSGSVKRGQRTRRRRRQCAWGRKGVARCIVEGTNGSGRGFRRARRAREIWRHACSAIGARALARQRHPVAHRCSRRRWRSAAGFGSDPPLLIQVGSPRFLQPDSTVTSIHARSLPVSTLRRGLRGRPLATDEYDTVFLYVLWSAGPPRGGRGEERRPAPTAAAGGCGMAASKPSRTNAPSHRRAACGHADMRTCGCTRRLGPRARAGPPPNEIYEEVGLNS